MGTLGEMVHNNKEGVVAMALREFHDQIN